MFTRLVILLASLWLVTVEHVYGSDSLSDSLNEILKEEGLTGVTWMTIDLSLGAQTKAVGLADAERELPLTPNHKVHVGSVTKMVLATGILRMASMGLIGLDDPVTDHVPNISFDNPWLDRPVTIRHLLDHTSGLEDARLWQMFSDRADPKAPMIHNFPNGAQSLLIRSRPGDIFSYSNSGYGLLGLLIEGVTGERYEAFLDRELLVPLGMLDSTFSYVTQAEDQRLAWGHFEGGRKAGSHPIALRPAGQFTTTMADMARLAKFMLGDGNLPDIASFIRPDLMAARGKPYDTIAAQKGLLPTYTLGLARRDRHGVVGYCHTGNIIGFYAMFCLFPNEQKAFAFSVNTDSETADYGRIAARIIESLNIQQLESPMIGQLPQNIEEKLGYYRLKHSRFDMFRYLDVALGFAALEREGDTLRFAPFQGGGYGLSPVGEGLYKASNRSTVSHVIYKDDQGVPHISSGFVTYEKVSGYSVAAHLAIIAFGGFGFLGLMVISLLAVRKKYRPVIGTLWPFWVGISLVFASVPLFMLYPFMALGDLTIANGLLTGSTILLPIFLTYGLLKTFRLADMPLRTVVALSYLAMLQWLVVMMAYGQWPVMLWV